MQKNKTHSQSGSVFFYILTAMAILAGLTYVVTRGGGDSASGLVASRIADDIRTQAQLLRSAIIECNLLHNEYPADPGAPTAIANLQCPAGQNMFSGATGRYAPDAPPIFTAGWVYRLNTATNPDSIYIELNQATNCTANQSLLSAFQILQNYFTATERANSVCDGTTARFRLNIITGS